MCPINFKVQLGWGLISKKRCSDLFDLSIVHNMYFCGAQKLLCCGAWIIHCGGANQKKYCCGALKIHCCGAWIIHCGEAKNKHCCGALIIRCCGAENNILLWS